MSKHSIEDHEREWQERRVNALNRMNLVIVLSHRDDKPRVNNPEDPGFMSRVDFSVEDLEELLLMLDGLTQ
jgi:uncharacterized protein (DUF1919 family)